MRRMTSAHNENISFATDMQWDFKISEKRIENNYILNIFTFSMYLEILSKILSPLSFSYSDNYASSI